MLTEDQYPEVFYIYVSNQPMTHIVMDLPTGFPPYRERKSSEIIWEYLIEGAVTLIK